jgi:hypothetical protein
MPPRPLSILKAQSSYIPLTTASAGLTPRTPFSSNRSFNAARPLPQSPFPAVLSTEEWIEVGEDGKLKPMTAVNPLGRRQADQQEPDWARWVKVGLLVLGALVVAGWGVSVWMVVSEDERRG